ncbi:MAG TPA: ATP-binding protein, partial [Gallionella sp.]
PPVWLNRTVIGVTVVISIATLPLFSALPNVYILSALAYVVLLAMGTAVATVGLQKSLEVRSRDGIFLASWGLLGMLFGLYDWLLQNNYVNIEGSYLGSYSNIIAFLIFTYIMFRRYVGAIEDVKQVNASLAMRLQAREAELTESHERLREIEHRQTLSQERQRLVQDMHDGLGSSLISALRVVERGQLDEAEVAEVLKGCIDDLKLAIDSMEPVEADLLLLLATLRFRLGPRLESTGIALRWEIEDVPALNWLNPRNALHILRILQEAFTNIIKHTHATEIRVATRFENDYVMVTITDNGQGFAVENALKSGGKGLSNQLRRAESIGAQISWDSNDTGTCLTLKLPIKHTWE